MSQLPTFEESESAFEAGTVTPIEMFVYCNEPDGEDEKEFREQLQAMLDYVRGGAE